MFLKKIYYLFFLLPSICAAQLADHVYLKNIKTVKLYKAGDIYSYPAIVLNTAEQVELHFDDMDADVKFYYYTYQLCNADWKPAHVQLFDYMRGFTSNRITTYRSSSIAQNRYTHYQALLPERNSTPTKGGNYLLKVYLDGDTSKLAFTKRLLIINPKASVMANVTQPFNQNVFRTHQRVTVNVSTASGQLNAFSPQDLKIAVLQNYNWQTTVLIDKPTVFRGNGYEYSDEDKMTFESGKEWRWIDIRSLRLRGDRVRQIVDSDTSDRVDIYVTPDQGRQQQLYFYYRDIDGLYTIENRDNPNPLWQGEYAWVHFTLIPPGNQAYAGREVYLNGELTNYAIHEDSRMEYNAEKGLYEKALFLKQGYYNYTYVTLPTRNDKNVAPTMEIVEGNHWGTENNYIVAVYFRPFGARADELVGFAKMNTLFPRQ
ncbi:MAG: hypothetical protein RL115_2385 [Bacteroidota bacterium]